MLEGSVEVKGWVDDTSTSALAVFDYVWVVRWVAAVVVGAFDCNVVVSYTCSYQFDLLF